MVHKATQRGASAPSVRRLEAGSTIRARARIELPEEAGRTRTSKRSSPAYGEILILAAVESGAHRRG